MLAADGALFAAKKAGRNRVVPPGHDEASGFRLSFGRAPTIRRFLRSAIDDSLLPNSARIASVCSPASGADR